MLSRLCQDNTLTVQPEVLTLYFSLYPPCLVVFVLILTYMKRREEKKRQKYYANSLKVLEYGSPACLTAKRLPSTKSFLSFLDKNTDLNLRLLHLGVFRCFLLRYILFRLFQCLNMPSIMGGAVQIKSSIILCVISCTGDISYIKMRYCKLSQTRPNWQICFCLFKKCNAWQIRIFHHIDTEVFLDRKNAFLTTME